MENILKRQAIIIVVWANVNLINFTRKMCVNLNSVLMILPDPNVSE